MSMYSYVKTGTCVQVSEYDYVFLESNIYLYVRVTSELFVGYVRIITMTGHQVAFGEKILSEIHLIIIT